MARKTKVRKHKREGTDGVKEHSRTLPDAPMGENKGNFNQWQGISREMLDKHGKDWVSKEYQNINRNESVLVYQDDVDAWTVAYNIPINSDNLSNVKYQYFVNKKSALDWAIKYMKNG